jgi:hypothetical protein
MPDYDNTIIRRLTWAPGRAKPRSISVLWSTGQPSPVAVQPPEGAVPVTAYRCVKCGFLEFYARS